MTVQTNLDRWIRRLRYTFIAQTVTTSIHHVYGGLAYDSIVRLSMPILSAIELAIVLGLLTRYQRTHSRTVLILFSVVAGLVGVVQGLFHALYGHLYKDLLFIAGVPADSVRNYFFPLLPNDFIYPPNNLFFELTGLLELVTIGLIIFFLYRLIREMRSVGSA